jgi:hypothetical protein
MANVPTPEFQKLWSNLIESLRLAYENTIQEHPDADAVMEHVQEVHTVIAFLAGCTPVSWWKSKMDFNCPKHDGHQEESPPVSERTAAV